MKRLGAEVHGRSVSLTRTYVEKEPKENKMKEDLEDLYNKLSGRAIVSNLANLSHNHYHNHHHQDSFVLPQRKLEFVSKLPKSIIVELFFLNRISPFIKITRECHDKINENGK